jgi:hypothetical protein
MIRRAWRTLERALRGAETQAPRWSLHQQMYDRAVLIVRVYYVITLFLLYDRGRQFTNLGLRVETLDPRWPVVWLDSVGLGLGGWILAHLALAAGLLGILFWRRLWVRLLVSVALLQFVALNNSFGWMGHAYHSWFWVSVAFWFLPSGRAASIGATRASRMRFLLGFSAAPGLFLLFYSLSGVYKVVHAFAALFTDDISGFAPYAMATTLAWRTFETGSEPLWASFVIQNPILGWPIYLTLYYVELFAIVVLFRPRLHQLWGMLLIGFHIGTFLFMDITFPEHVLINGLLLVLSPFALGLTDWHRALVALPVIGPALAAVLRRRAPLPPAIAARRMPDHAE